MAARSSIGLAGIPALILVSLGTALAADLAASASAREVIRKELPKHNASLRKTLKAGKAARARLQKVERSIAGLEARLEAIERRRANLSDKGSSTLLDQETKSLDRKEAEVRKALKGCVVETEKLRPGVSATQTGLAEVVASLAGRRRELLELELELGKHDRGPLLELAQVHAVVLDENAARPDNIGQDFEKAKVRLTRKLSVDVVEKGRRWILRDAVKRSSFSMELDGSTIKVYGAAGKDERGKDVQKEAKELQKLGAEVAARRDEGQTNLDALNALLARLTEIADKHG